MYKSLPCSSLQSFPVLVSDLKLSWLTSLTTSILGLSRLEEGESLLRYFDRLMILYSRIIFSGS